LAKPKSASLIITSWEEEKYGHHFTHVQTKLLVQVLHNVTLNKSPFKILQHFILWFSYDFMAAVLVFQKDHFIDLSPLGRFRAKYETNY